MDSIVGQTFSDWELIVVNDASSDRTLELIKSYNDPRVIVINNDTNNGLTKNLNKALEIASGEYIIRMDGDDVAFLGRIKKQVEFMDLNPDIVVCGGSVMFIGEQHGISEYTSEDSALRFGLLFDAVMAHPTIIIRKRILDEYGIRYNEKLKYAQDYYLEYQLSKVGKIHNISNVLIKYRKHKEQISVKKRTDQISCADYVRKTILKDLSIELSDEEFRLWSSFCRWDFSEVSSKDVDTLKNVCDKVACYGTDFVKESLKHKLNLRLNEFICHCNECVCETKYDKYRDLFNMLGIWIRNLIDGKSISAILLRMGINRVMIYGASVAGKRLREEICSDIEVVGFIDRNMYLLSDENTEIYDPVESFPYTDAIIISPISCFDEISEQMSIKAKNGCLSLYDLIIETSLC